MGSPPPYMQQVTLCADSHVQKDGHMYMKNKCLLGELSHLGKHLKRARPLGIVGEIV